MHLLLIIKQHFLRERKIKTVSEFIHNYYLKNQSQLQKLYPGLTFNRLLSEYVFFSKHSEKEVFVRPYSQFFQKLEEGIPLEYINENRFFYEHNFYVDQNVLIPRNESEILVDFVVKAMKKDSSICSICEIGVGSGALILSVLAAIGREVSALGIDINEAVLNVAKKNYFRLSNCIFPESDLTLIMNDRLNGITQKFDLIFSNPPYIKKDADLKKVHEQVLKYEPHQALFINDQEYDKWFEDFFGQIYSCLNEKGMFIMEGHEDHLERLKNLASNIFENVSLMQDFTGANRFLIFQKEI